MSDYNQINIFICINSKIQKYICQQTLLHRSLLLIECFIIEKDKFPKRQKLNNYRNFDIKLISNQLHRNINKLSAIKRVEKKYLQHKKIDNVNTCTNVTC